MSGFVDDLLATVDSIPDLEPPLRVHASNKVNSESFKQTSDLELRRLIDKNINKNTQKSTNTWVRRFTAWRTARGTEGEPIENKSAAEIDDILAHFYAELRRKKRHKLRTR